MVKTILTVDVEPEGEVSRLLSLAREAPVLVEQNGVRYRLSRESNDSGGVYDPEQFRAVLRRVAGILDPEEAEQMKEMIYRAREEGTRPPNRP
ncbi:MAG: hypothetical protein H0U10_02420 [Chloroflexia bacterium]|nr:hypothetical protein [Chloroflexia bacterium]